MPNELYWEGDCHLTKSYRKMNKIKTKQSNQELWLQGMYFYEALIDVSPLLNAFAKNPKPTPYPSEPFAITQEEVDEREIRAQKKLFDEGIQRAKTWATETNASLKAGKEEDNE